MVTLFWVVILVIGTMKILLGSNDANMWTWVLPALIGLLLFMGSGIGLMAALFGVSGAPA